jgi:tetratricopeptide (TPR) repeat protein
MKRVLFLALILVLSSAAFAQNTPQPFDLSQYGVRIEPDRRLIVVLAALEAAGLETPLTAKGKDFRQKLRTDLASLYVPSKNAAETTLQQKMKFFVDQYKKRHDKATDAELVAPFISMAYALGPVPDLAEPTRATDLPGDLLEVLDFSPLVRQFYRAPIQVPDGAAEKTTTVGARIEEYYKEYQATGDALRPSTVRMVRSLLDYLHTRPQTTYLEQIKTEVQKSKKTTLAKTETRERERRFFIVPDLLAQNGTINFRNIGDDYYAIVPPGTDLGESEVRRAYLQFVLDPVILKNAKDISTFKDGIKALLDERRKTNPEISPDIFLAVSRSLVAAADARQTFYQRFQEATFEARRAASAGRKPISETTDAQGRKIVKLTDELYLIDGRFAMPEAEDEMNLKLYEAYEKGAVLSFYFANGLKGLEESQFDIASSLRDIILSLDTKKEENRLAENADARQRALALREEQRKRAATVLENPLTKKLTEVEPLIQTQKYAEAEAELNQLLKTNPTEPRVFYALGRVKSLSAAAITDAERRNQLIGEAKEFYTKVLNSATEKTDAALISLTYVALARLYEYYDQNAYAIKIYEKAISMGDMPGGGYQEAVVARERLLKEQ